MEKTQVYLRENWDIVIGLLIAYFSLILPIYRYLKDRRKEEKNKRFDNFHRLLDDLLGGKEGQQVKLDRQIAIIYELRNFKEYYPVILRIISNLKVHWEEKGPPQLIKELEFTENYINSSKFSRYFFKH